VGGPPLPQSKYNTADGRHPKIDVTSYFRSGCSDLDKTRQPDAEWHADYGEVEFQYGGRLFFKNGSSYISAINWVMSTKFGFLIDFDLLKAVTSTNTKPEVVLSGCGGRHLEKCIWRHIFAMGATIWTKFGSLMQKNTPITASWSRSKPDVEFQFGRCLYFETGYSYISAANWDIYTKFGLLTEFDLLKAVTSTNTKPKVVFSGHGRHLEKWIIHISAVGASNWTEFSSLMQNNMHITVNWSRSKPEVKFQYGGR